MTTTSTSGPRWRVENNAALIVADRFAARLSAFDSRRGLHQLTVDGNSLGESSLLQIELPASSAEISPASVYCYARENDLICTFDETEDRRYRAQAYWRALRGEHEGEIFGVELVASIQTSMLEGFPALSVVSESPASELICLDALESSPAATVVDGEKGATFAQQSPDGCFVVRLSGEMSYLEMTHPLDFRETRATFETFAGAAPLGRKARLVRSLFSRPLEKGVILRSRVLGMFVARQNDLATAAAVFRRFAASPAPLTT